jgi:bifunctional pyridoxal-dependent enzyme with beta-cystathionase and maltose regulon repressor activities
MDSYLESLESFMRINFGCPKSLLEEGLERIKRAIEKRIG